jgi:hypothetical protein
LPLQFKTAEERFLWMQSFYRFMNVQTVDQNYKMPKIIKEYYDPLGFKGKHL